MNMIKIPRIYSQMKTNGGILPNNKKETKEQMSIILTPTHKKKLRKMADNLNMSARELIGYWIEKE